MASYKLTRKADADLRSAFLYGLKEHGEARALQYKQSLDARFQEIADDPLRFPKTDFYDGYRYSVHQLYTIYFKSLDNGDVRIIRICVAKTPAMRSEQCIST